MITINLLPWRERNRTHQKRQLVIVFLLGLCGVLIFDLFWSLILQNNISHQNVRNDLLQKEVAKAKAILQKKPEMQREKESILNQAAILKNLHDQGLRVIECLNILPKILPNGTYLSALKVKKNYFELQGEAPADLQISELMKSLKQQATWSNVKLLEIESKAKPKFWIGFNIE